MQDLIARTRSGDRQAEEQLIRKFTPMVHSVARPLYAPGAEHDDLVQEGFIGLVEAIRDYDGQGYFPAFAAMCIRRKILSHIIYCRRGKFSYLNDAAPLEDDAYRIAGKSPSPERVAIGRESLRELGRAMERLSELEGRMLRLKAEGYGQLESARISGCKIRMVDNALQRVKEKLLSFRVEQFFDCV